MENNFMNTTGKALAVCQYGEILHILRQRYFLENIRKITKC